VVVTVRSPESHILLATARQDLTAVGDLRRWVATSPDWDAVVAWALAHGTAGLLCRHLIEAAPDLLPDDLREAAGAYLRCESERNVGARAQLAAVLGALNAVGIEAIPFKGPVLAAQVYDDPASRGFADLDFLIDERNVGPTMATLAQLGYRSDVADLRQRHREKYHAYNGQDILFADQALPVEPHWALAPTTFDIRLDMPTIRRRAVTIAFAGSNIRCLSPEDTLLVAAVHGCKESWWRLIWLVDVAELLRRNQGLDWDYLDRQSAASGVGRMLRLSLALAARVLDAELPDRVRSAIVADRVCQRLARRIGDRLAPAYLDDAIPGGGSVFRLSAESLLARERFTDRFRYAFRTLTTARVQHFRMLDLPDWLEFAYPLFKVAHDYVALPAWLAGKAVMARVRAATTGTGADRGRAA